MGKRSFSLRLSEGELELLQMLWREDGVTILEAQKSLGLPIGYTTVQTRLNRLVKKGVAKKSKQRPAKYHATITAEDVSRSDLEMLVQRVCNGSCLPLVAHLVSDKSVSAEELSELKKLVTAAEAKARQEERDD
ncbi:MAG: BlaI/MecI/CopY family transcriptional regulator [Aureliella sp.]